MRKKRNPSMAKLLATHGLRCTCQRLALYKALAATKAHPTAEQLHHDAKHRVRGLSLATVYNTLEAFCACGLAQELASNDGRAHYDANVDSHPHLRDSATGQISDIPEPLATNLLAGVPRGVLAKIETNMACQIAQVRIELVSTPRDRNRN